MIKSVQPIIPVYLNQRIVFKPPTPGASPPHRAVGRTESNFLSLSVSHAGTTRRLFGLLPKS